MRNPFPSFLGLSLVRLTKKEREEDRYVLGRSHGMAIDQPLPDYWWQLSGYEFKVTGNAFTYDTSVTFGTIGTHYVEYAASGYVPNYAWHARIYVNGNLLGEGDVGRNQHLRVYFTVSQ
jgi:hypothetical protein